MLAQRLVINISDASDNSAPPVIITFRNVEDTLQIKEFLSTDSKQTVYDLQFEYSGLLVMVSSLGYETQQEVIPQPAVDQTYEL